MPTSIIATGPATRAARRATSRRSEEPHDALPISNPASWVAEELEWQALAKELGEDAHIYYRHRARNTGRKAGNIQEIGRATRRSSDLQSRQLGGGGTGMAGSSQGVGRGCPHLLSPPGPQHGPQGGQHPGDRKSHTTLFRSPIPPAGWRRNWNGRL